MNEQYEQYLKECHSSNAGNISIRNIIEILDAPENYPLWTSKGIAGGYKWRSLTTVFSPELHFIDSKKRKINDLFATLISQSGLHMMSHLVRSIEADNEYSHLLNDSNLLIANSDVLFAGGNLEYERGLAIGMREYLRQNITLNDDNCLFLDNSHLKLIDENIKDTNILFPLPILMKGRLNFFATISKALCMRGAKTVYGVFLSYSVPTANGEELGKYPNIPPIQGMSFSDFANMF